MPVNELHLVKVPLRPERLVAVARRRGISVRDFDEGYLTHCVLRELWQEKAPSPFVLKGRQRSLDAWGYSTSSASALQEHLRAFSDPELLQIVEDVEGISSRTMPIFKPGQRVGFLLRASPVVRLAKGRAGHRAGAEVDAFLAKCFAVGPGVDVSRQDVYRDWLSTRLSGEGLGMRVERISVAGIARERLTRRTQGERREARQLERPEVHFEGDLVIEEGRAFLGLLAKGIGRHRAFGFGTLLVVPPGTHHESPASPPFDRERRSAGDR